MANFNFVRKFLKEFAATNKGTNLQVFGSKSSGSPALSSDPEVLQDNANFGLAWAGATILNPGNNTRNPIQDEWSGLQYIHNYHTNYILQKGIPEYNNQTVYYIGDICREIGGLKLYQSKTDENVGNALSDDTEWQLSSALENTNTININAESDWGVPSGGVVTLKNGKYNLNTTVTRAVKLLIPDGVSVSISSNYLGIADIYTGIGNGIEALGSGILYTNTIVFVAPTATAIFTDNERSSFFTTTIMDTVDTAARIQGSQCSFVFCGISNFNNGVISADRTDGMPRVTFAMELSSITDGLDSGGTLLDISGKLLSLGLGADNLISPKASETALNLQQSLKENNTSIIINNTIFDKSLGTIFAANSIRQDYVNATFSGNLGIKNSTSSAKLDFVSNSAVTTITVTDQDEAINTNVLYNLSVLERFLIQDICTFDNTTDTVNTTFNHGLSLNDRVFLNAYAGSSLPAELDETTEYFVVNPTATSFQLSLTESGSAIDFTDDGSGTLYYRHNTGVSLSGEIIYIGNENIGLKIAGWVALTSTTGTVINMGSSIMKIALDGTITQDQTGSRISADNTDTQSSIDTDLIELASGEGVVIYIKNQTNVVNIIAEDFLITLTKI